MEGDYAEFFTNSILNMNVDVRLLARDSSVFYHRKGKKPKLQISVKDDVSIPLNFDSLAMLSAYYSIEQIIDFWRHHGLDFRDKYTFFYAPVYYSKKKYGAVKKKFNAAYVDNTKFFLLYKTSNEELIPFSMNKFILAHEFGHLMFNKAFVNNRPIFFENDDNLMQSVLRAINEGCADFFAYTVTARTDELQASQLAAFRDRTLPATFRSYDLANKRVQGSGIEYYWGSVLASALYELSVLDNIGRVVVAKSLYRSLEKLRSDWEDTYESLGFNFYHLLRRLIDQAPFHDKKYYCKRFKYWFNDSMNYWEISSYCQDLHL
jgi:hypothetical protein